MALRFGTLRHRIEIFTPPTGATKNAYGEWSDDYTSVGTRWGSVETLSGAEVIQAAQQQATASHKVMLRYFDGLTPRHRLKFGARIFNIERIDDQKSTKSVHVLWVKELQ